MNNFEVKYMYINHFKDNILPHLPKSSIDIIQWLSERWFFDTPASTKHHGNERGGLFRHSALVMDILVKLTEDNHLQWSRPESPYIVGFFHDLCKIDQYRSITIDGRECISYIDETLFKGHGEKSVMLLSTLFQLTEEEVACICYHMGAFCDKDLWNDYTRAIYSYPNVLWTHHADMIAAHVMHDNREYAIDRLEENKHAKNK